MLNLSLGQISLISAGNLAGDSNVLATSVAIDSRQVQAGAIFFCLKGQHTDGHLYLTEAFERGAVAAIVERDVISPPGLHLIHVSSTRQALFRLATHWRSSFHPLTVAITGTVGKTTTKELISFLLEEKAPVLKSAGNQNTEYGIPLTVFRLEDRHQYLILELALQEPGDISFLAELARPQIGVLTEIGPAHLEFMGSLEKILEEKWSLFSYLPADAGVAVLNGDNPLIRRKSLPACLRAVYYSLGGEGDVSGKLVAEGNKPRIEVNVFGSTVTLSLPFAGRHFIKDFLAAAAVCSVLGLNLKGLADKIMSFPIPPGRGRVISLKKGISLIDDAYNANPLSSLAALEDLSRKEGGRKIAVLADMLELGENAPLFHQELGAACPSLVDELFLFGSLALEIGKGALANGMPASSVRNFFSRDDLVKALRKFLKPGDWILVKGSRGMQMNSVVKLLEGEEYDLD